MTDRLKQIDWRLWALWAAAVLAWCVQYLLVAPLVTLAAGVGWVIRGALKLGVVGLLLLFVPIIGWAILALWLLLRSSDRAAERRHLEQMAALGVDPAPDPVPLWRTIWQPWLRDALERGRLQRPTVG